MVAIEKSKLSEFKDAVKRRGIVVSADNEFVQKAIDNILKWIANGCKDLRYTLQHVIADTEYTGENDCFSRMFRDSTDFAPRDYITKIAGNPNEIVSRAVLKHLSNSSIIHSDAGTKLENIARAVGVPPSASSTLSSKFKKATGMTLASYIKARKNGDDPLADWQSSGVALPEENLA